MPPLRAAEDALMSHMPRGAQSGSTWFGKLGDVVQQPPVWAAVGAVLALGGGARGRRAAVRGSALYAATAAVANVVKLVVGRGRPPGSDEDRVGPLTSSFPSGHAATDLAFALGAAQEIPLLFVPLAGATTAAHWSLVRSRGHYPSDVLAGGVLAVAVALVAWRLWPPGARNDEGDPAVGGEGRGQEGR